MSPRLQALRSTQTFDVLVLGSQVAGAVAGALLARRGYRVLAVEHAPLTTGYVEGNHRLPLGPTLLPQLRHLPAAQTVLDELGLWPEAGRAAQNLAGVQILEGHARLDLFIEAGRRNAEIQREFGGKAAGHARAIDALIKREEQNGPIFAGHLPLPAEGAIERWRQGRASTALQIGNAAELVTPVDHPLSRGLKELWRLSNNLVEQESLPEPNVVSQPARAALRPLGQWLRGLCHFPGGEAGLAALLRRRIEASGGTVLSGEGAVVEELIVEGGRIAAIKLLDSPNQYRARTVVAALDSDSLRELIPAGARQGRWTHGLEAVRTRSQLVTLNLIIPAGGLPPGLAEAAVGLPAGQGRSFFFQVIPAERVSGPTPAGEKLVTLCMQVPPQSLGAGEEAVRKLIQELRRNAELFLPFLGHHVALESSPQLSAHDAGGTTRRLHPRLEIARLRQLGVTGLGPRSVLKNVVLASHEVLPGLGLEGQFLSGLGAAGIVQRMVKKADPLAKQG